MRKIILTLAAVAAVGTAAVAPAEARGFGRGAAIGVGVGAAALGAAVAAGAYNNGYYGPGYVYGSAPADGYYDTPGYYDDGPRAISGESTATTVTGKTDTVTGKTEEPGFGRAFSLFKVLSNSQPHSQLSQPHAH